MRPSVREQLGEEALSRAKEALREPDGFGVFVRDGLYASGAAGVDRRLGVGEDDRRVGGEDQLRAGADEFVDASQEGEAVLGARPALWPGIAAGERRRPAHERSPAPCRSPGSNRRWGRCVGMVATLHHAVLALLSAEGVAQTLRAATDYPEVITPGVPKTA